MLQTEMVQTERQIDGGREHVDRDDLDDPATLDAPAPASGDSGPPGRVLGRLRSLVTSAGEREEAALARRLRAAPPVTRANGIALVSPKGGVGKTTCTFLLGNVLAAALRLRVLAVDANRDFGTLASLAPDRTRVDRSLSDLLTDKEQVGCAAALLPYVSRLPTGLHLLASPAIVDQMTALAPGDYRVLLQFLARFYDVILLDFGAGIAGPLARFGIDWADQTILVTAPEYVTATKVLDSLRHLGVGSQAGDTGLDPDNVTVALNRVPARRSGDGEAIGRAVRERGISGQVTIPDDERLRVMLDSGTYSLDALPRAVRLPIKRLAAIVAERLV